MQPDKGEITLLLAKWKDGEASAFEELMPLVYPHLRQVAAAYVRRERNPDRLYSMIDGAWQYKDYTYKEAAPTP